MSDPKNIPLSEARPGDIVYLKPAHIAEVEKGGIRTYAGRCYERGDIDHIERAPRVLKVGLAQFRGTDTQVEVVAIVDGWAAWVRKGYKASNGWKPVDELEPVDD